MRILFVADVFGAPGRRAVETRLQELRHELEIDFCVVNGENAADGAGLTAKLATRLLERGADVVTTGNHVWRHADLVPVLESSDRVLRPANLGGLGAPGRGTTVQRAAEGTAVAVVNLEGALFMDTQVHPFLVAEELVERARQETPVVLVDFHAEATSEKMCFAHFVDGRASLVVGTHTHQPTADHQILNGGTAYLTDAGMCGDYDSSLGMDKEEPLNRFLSKVPKGRFEAAHGPATICGVGVDISDRTGLAERIAPLRRGPRLEETVPFFWS